MDWTLHWAGAVVLNYPAPDIDIELNNVILLPPLTIHHPQVENYTIWQSGLNAEITCAYKVVNRYYLDRGFQ